MFNTYSETTATIITFSSNTPSPVPYITTITILTTGTVYPKESTLP